MACRLFTSLPAASTVVPAMDKQKIRDLDDLELAQIIEDHFGSQNLKKYPSGVWYFDGQIWRPFSYAKLKAEVTYVLSQNVDQVKDGRVKNTISLFKSHHYDEDERFELGDQNTVVMKDDYYSFNGNTWNNQAPDRALMRRIQLPASYVDDQPVVFNKFLDDILCDAEGHALPDATELRQLIWEMLGYCLVTHTRYEQFFILCGAGANGKSVLGAVAKEIVGRKQTCSVQPNKMGSVFQRAYLEGKLLNLVTELNQNTELEDGIIKAVVSGERMTVEAKYQDPRDIEPFAKHIILTNHMPRIRDYSDGLFRRISIISLQRQFMGTDADPHLLEKLTDELDAITSRAMDALGQLINRKGKFTKPQSSKQALEEWRMENNHLSEFAAERLYEVPQAKLSVQAAYDDYEIWFSKTGRLGKLGRGQFSKQMEAHLRIPKKRTEAGYCFIGVTLR